jgi:hypothetical protein
LSQKNGDRNKTPMPTISVSPINLPIPLKIVGFLREAKSSLAAIMAQPILSDSWVAPIGELPSFLPITKVNQHHSSSLLFDSIQMVANSPSFQFSFPPSLPSAAFAASRPPLINSLDSSFNRSHYSAPHMSNPNKYFYFYSCLCPAAVSNPIYTSFKHLITIFPFFLTFLMANKNLINFFGRDKASSMKSGGREKISSPSFHSAFGQWKSKWGQ